MSDAGKVIHETTVQVTELQELAELCQGIWELHTDDGLAYFGFNGGLARRNDMTDILDAFLQEESLARLEEHARAL